MSFWQIVSSFSSNLYVPWPSIYYALSSSLNVVSLQVRTLQMCCNVYPTVLCADARLLNACVPLQFLKLPASASRC